MTTLNAQQRRAVRVTDRPLLVLAGAGSGKTRVITQKIAALVADGGMDPAHITAVTFTNKAAREMRRRVSRLLDEANAKRINVSTFHTLGLNIIRAEHEQLGYRRGFSIVDSEDAANMVRELMRMELSTDPGLAAQVQHRISAWKNALISPAQAPALADDDPIARAAARVYEPYNRQLKACNSLDLDDLVYVPVRHLQASAQVRTAWRERIRYLLVDEYQDTNGMQYEMVKLLVGERGGLTVVGDDDQSIYAWRGARPENLQQLAQDFPGLEVVKLEQNYRSSGRILKAANAVIARNHHIFEKRLWSELGYGDPVRIIRAGDEENEAQRVVSAILHHRFSKRTPYGEFAILYRGNHQSRLFEKTLREHQIPYYLSGEISFFERSEVKDMMAYLRLLANPADDNAFLRIVNTPRRGIGPATLEKLSAFAGTRGGGLLAAAQDPQCSMHIKDRGAAALRGFAHMIGSLSEQAANASVHAVIKELLKETDYRAWLQETSRDEASFDRRWENVDELLAWVRRAASRDNDKHLTDVVADLIVAGILEREDNEAGSEQVALMTLHAAKGLEFPHVFLVGAEENLLPHRTSIEDETIEEERRLFYVGITRAQKTLALSFAKKRKRFGETIDCVPSRFLDELPADDLQWEGLDHGLAPEEKKQRARAHLDNLRTLLDT